MRELSEFLSTRGMTVECFFWSGIPLSIPVRYAAMQLLSRLQALVGPHVIWAKSTGADIANLAARRTPIKVIVRVAPGYVVSRQIELSARGLTVELAEDRFLDRWDGVGIIRKLEPPNSEPRYIVNGAPGIDHHALNLNRHVRLQDGREVDLYDLYAELIDQARGL